MFQVMGPLPFLLFCALALAPAFIALAIGVATSKSDVPKATWLACGGLLLCAAGHVTHRLYILAHVALNGRGNVGPSDVAIGHAAMSMGLFAWHMPVELLVGVAALVLSVVSLRREPWWLGVAPIGWSGVVLMNAFTMA